MKKGDYVVIAAVLFISLLLFIPSFLPSGEKTAEVYVDGEKVKSVASTMEDGWNNPVTAYLIDNDESAEHEVEIRVEGGEKAAYFVLAFGYCD